jgi:hypothetical protein
VLALIAGVMGIVYLGLPEMTQRRPVYLDLPEMTQRRPVYLDLPEMTQRRPIAIPKQIESFPNCDAARAAGRNPIRQGEQGYSPHLDRDGGGIACEPWRRRS